MVLSISVVNAHIIYTKCSLGPHKPLKALIQSIITSLLEGYFKKEGKKGRRPSMQQGESHRGSRNDTGSVIRMIIQIALRVLIAAAPKAVARHSSGAVSVE